MMIYLLTAIVLTPGGSSTVHIYTQTIQRTTQSTQTTHFSAVALRPNAGHGLLILEVPSLPTTTHHSR